MTQATADYAALVGIDWADCKHDLCLQAAGSDRRERLVLEHRPGLDHKSAHPGHAASGVR